MGPDLCSEYIHFQGRGGNCNQIVVYPFWKRVHSKRYDFAAMGRKFIPLRVHHFWEVGFVCRKANDDTKWSLVMPNWPKISSRGPFQPIEDWKPLNW